MNDIGKRHETCKSSVSCNDGEVSSRSLDLKVRDGPKGVSDGVRVFLQVLWLAAQVAREPQEDAAELPFNSGESGVPPPDLLPSC